MPSLCDASRALPPRAFAPPVPAADGEQHEHHRPGRCSNGPAGHFRQSPNHACCQCRSPGKNEYLLSCRSFVPPESATRLCNSLLDGFVDGLEATHRLRQPSSPRRCDHVEYWTDIARVDPGRTDPSDFIEPKGAFFIGTGRHESTRRVASKECDRARRQIDDHSAIGRLAGLSVLSGDDFPRSCCKERFGCCLSGEIGHYILPSCHV